LAGLIMPVALSLESAIAAPVVVPYGETPWGPWAPHYLIWFGLGLVFLLIAAFRRRDVS
jgi:hypothetical protein